MPTLKVFISSVMSEFTKERIAVEAAIQEIGQTPISFEIFPAFSGEPEEIIFDLLKECDIFILLIGKSLSDIVIAEFKFAVENDIDILIFRKNMKMDSSSMTFIEEIGNIYKYRNFDDVDDLKISVNNSVQYLLVDLFRHKKSSKGKSLIRIDKTVRLSAEEVIVEKFEDLSLGTKVKGILREENEDTFNVYFVNQKNYAKFRKGKPFKYWGDEKTSVHSFDFVIEEEDDYYFILKSPAILFSRVVIVDVRLR